MCRNEFIFHTHYSSNLSAAAAAAHFCMCVLLLLQEMQPRKTRGSEKHVRIHRDHLPSSDLTVLITQIINIHNSNVKSKNWISYRNIRSEHSGLILSNITRTSYKRFNVTVERLSYLL